MFMILRCSYLKFSEQNWGFKFIIWRWLGGL